MFICIEGGDATGKATQTKLLVERFRQVYGEQPVVYSFPRYDTRLGGLIRDRLKREAAWVTLKGDMYELTGEIQSDMERSYDNGLVLQCLMVMDRIEVASEVAAHLQAGKVVIADRWWQSTVVYGAIDGVEEEWSRRVSSILPVCDLNVLLDLDATIATYRRPVPRDFYEQSLRIREQARKSYCALWDPKLNARDPAWTAVNASLDVNTVHDAIWSKVASIYGRKLAP